MKNNHKKGQMGFTLIEVIVVAVIVAALAGVAVPLYLGYIETSRNNSASNAAGSAASFCGACVNLSGIPSNSVAAGTAGGVLSCTTNTATMNVPAEIIITIVTVGPPGSVTGKHTGAAGVATFSF